MDRISSLPDELICHIGSLLPAKEAASAMVLAKRWRNLFNIVQELHFGDDSANDGESLSDFVDGVLDLPVNSRIRKFSLTLVLDDTDHAHINRCLRHVLKRGVMVLKLEIYVGEDEVYSLPLDAFTCNTVTELTLGSGFVIDSLPKDAYLPSLKTLCLDSIRFCEFGRCTFNPVTLLSVSPVLEEFIIDGFEFERRKWSFPVSSLSLQRFTIRPEEWKMKRI